MFYFFYYLFLSSITKDLDNIKPKNNQTRAKFHRFPEKKAPGMDEKNKTVNTAYSPIVQVLNKFDIDFTNGITRHEKSTIPPSYNN